MGHITLTLLCLATNILVVTPLAPDAVFRVTRYIENNIFQRFTGQYAYLVKFTDDECKAGLDYPTLRAALEGIDGAEVRGILINNNRPIYEGTRMVAAAPIKRLSRNNIPYKDHAEYNLLYDDYYGDSPVLWLLADNTDQTGCVVFFSVLSPCVNRCTDINGRYNIITPLRNVNLPDNLNNRAFAFRIPYKNEPSEPSETDTWAAWAALDDLMPLYRCNNNNCIQCFDNNGNRVAACYA